MKETYVIYAAFAMIILLQMIMVQLCRSRQKKEITHAEALKNSLELSHEYIQGLQKSIKEIKERGEDLSTIFLLLPELVSKLASYNEKEQVFEITIDGVDRLLKPKRSYLFTEKEGYWVAAVKKGSDNNGAEPRCGKAEGILGVAEVRATFRAPRLGTIAGSYVTEGEITRGARIRLVRDGVVVYDGRVASLRRFKDDTRSVSAGFECGIGLTNYNDVKPGEVGEIIAKSKTIMVEYWKKPEETREVLVDGWLHTGDMGYYDDKGFIYLVDRKRDMIVSGGENVYPREVEEVLYRHTSIEEAAVIGIPDPYWVERVHAVVVLKKGAEAAEDEIIDFCKSHIAHYKAPKSVEFVDSLPKNPQGKILKRVLRERY